MFRTCLVLCVVGFFFSASHFTLSASLHLRINVDSGKLPGKPDEMFFFWKGGGGNL